MNVDDINQTKLKIIECYHIGVREEKLQFPILKIQYYKPIIAENLVMQIPYYDYYTLSQNEGYIFPTNIEGIVKFHHGCVYQNYHQERKSTVNRSKFCFYTNHEIRRKKCAATNVYHLDLLYDSKLPLYNYLGAMTDFAKK